GGLAEGDRAMRRGGDPLDREVARAVQAADSPLDDVTRMRIQARIASAASAAGARGAAPRRSGLRFAVVLGSAAFMLIAFHGRTPPTRQTDDVAAARFTHLEVPAGSRLQTTLGKRARIALKGPAELQVLAATATLLEIRLSRGLLVGEY